MTYDILEEKERLEDFEHQEKNNECFEKRIRCWDAESKRLGLRNVDRARERLCGDCIHLRAPQVNKNSNSYNNCRITGYSKDLYEKGCSKFWLREYKS